MFSGGKLTWWNDYDRERRYYTLETPDGLILRFDYTAREIEEYKLHTHQAVMQHLTKLIHKE